MTSGKNLRRQVFSFLLLLVWLIPALYSQELLFFYERGCPFCAKISSFLDNRIRPNYPVTIKNYEIHQPEQAKLMMDLAKAYRAQDILDKGTPAVFIGDSAFQGSSRFIQRKIEEAVRRAVRDKAASPLARLPIANRPEKFTSKITLPAVIGAAAVDAINPCACAVLVLLLGTILVASKRRKAVLGAGFSFTAACFISYFLMGIGLFAAVHASGIQHYIYIAVSLLAIFLGLWNTKDFIWKGRWFSIEVPRSWQPVLKRITSSISSALGAFFIGFLISLFLLPCTSGPYVVVIGMLSSVATRMQAVWLLLLYNLIFIQPFVIITLAVGLGFTTTARVEKWRQEKLRQLHLFSGLFMLALGATLIFLLILGTI